MTHGGEEIFSFGMWVRRRRKALDLTQAALAHRVGCAEITIRKLEANDFRPSREVAERLACCLEIPSEHRGLFVQIARAERRVDRLPVTLVSIGIDPTNTTTGAILDGGQANVLSTSQQPSGSLTPLQNLPDEPAPLIGREREIAEIWSQLTHPDVRLLTLTGPGGIGKTRLSLAVAAEAAPHFTDGVFFVPLAAVADPLLVPATIAQVLGIQEIVGKTLVEGIKSYVRPRNILLILDNFEHVLPSATVVSELLRTAPGLKVLVTSRALLHLHSERYVSVPSLMYPDPAMACAPEMLLQCAAIQLFIQRARAVKPDYPFTEAAISAVAQICQRLDGLPLAIELAAARIRLFSPSGILSRLDQSLPFLRGGSADTDVRHQTLEHTIAWSYDLLAPPERTLFRRMAVFVDGATLEATISVCNLEDTLDLDLLDGVQALLDKSLLKEHVTASGELRFGMLETIRQFALKQLTVSGEHELVAPRHAAYYKTLAEQAESRLLGEETIPWLDQIDAEYGNLRTALAWLKSRSDRVGACFQLAGALCRFWDLRGQFAEGRAWLESLLAQSGDIPAAVRAKVLDGAGVLARSQGDYTQAQMFHEESLALWTKLDNSLGIARSHLHLGLVAYNAGDFLKAKPHLDTVLTMFTDVSPATKEAGEVFAETLNALGMIFRGHSDFEQAGLYFERALLFSRKLRNRRNEAQILSNFGAMKNTQRQYRAAQVYLKQSLELRRTLRDHSGEAVTLYNLGVAEQETYQYGNAQAHFLAALKVHETTGNRWEQINVQLGLGILYHQIGDLTKAHTWLQRALMLSDEIGDAVGQAFVLANLGPVVRDMEDLKRAEQILHQGCRLAQIHKDKGTMSYCLSALGMVYLAADRAGEAVDAALRALTLRREIGILAWTTTDLATLTTAHLALGQWDQARIYADAALVLLAEHGADELECPQRDYFMCSQVYAALEQADQARSALQSAYSIVLTRAAKITDSAIRQSFLTCVPINHAIIQAVESTRSLPTSSRQNVRYAC